jgi:hypothetical protein
LGERRGTTARIAATASPRARADSANNSVRTGVENLRSRVSKRKILTFRY